MKAGIRAAPKYQGNNNTTIIKTKAKPNDAPSSATFVQYGLVIFLPVIIVAKDAPIKSCE